MGATAQRPVGGVRAGRDGGAELPLVLRLVNDQGQVIGIERSRHRRDRSRGTGVRRSAKEPRQRDVLLIDGHD